MTIKPEAVKGQLQRDRCLDYFLIATHPLQHHFVIRWQSKPTKRQHKNQVDRTAAVWTAIKRPVLHRSSHENCGTKIRKWMFTLAISRQFSASAESLLGLQCLSSGVMGHSRAFWQTGTALRSTLLCTLAFVVSPAEFYTTAKSSCEMFVCPNSHALIFMRSPSISHQFP